jgi:peptide/nickel transport system substrate-binding protein
MPALAQKSRNTLRGYAIESVSIIDPVTNPQSGGGPTNRAIQDSLLTFDWDAGKYVSLLAKQWRLIDDKTIEFDLRDDIVFHDGSAFDADDVVDVFNYLASPGVNFLFKSSTFGNLERAEKLSLYKVRFRAGRPLATLLSQTAEAYRIYPSDKYVGNKDTFGRMPIGTGPYRVVQVDPGRGIVLEKSASFKHGNVNRPAARIGRVEIRYLPDMQTQMANLLIGELDLMSGVNPDIAADLLKRPEFRLSAVDVLAVTYIQFDVVNRSGINALKDQRVRQALSMAIDRASIKANFLPESVQNLPLPNSVCHPSVLACSSDAQPVEFNPAKAKELLTEAGYKDGFEITVSTFGPTKDLATAVAGNLRNIGVRASVDYLTYTAYNKKRAEGQLQSAIAFWANSAGKSDGAQTVDFFFQRGERDYFRDETLFAAADKAAGMMDVGTRTGIYKSIFEQMVDKNYVMPLIPWPSLVVHHKDVVVERGPKNSDGYEYNYLRWAN